jgi:hypothetical protein
MLLATSFRFRRFLFKTLSLFFGLSLLAASIPALHAQAVPASQRKAEVSAFALYSRVTPDYGPTNNNGMTVGFDYTRLTNWWVKPSLELRAKFANGTTADEKTFGGGIRAVKPMGKFSPYADFMLSYGSINLHLQNPPLLADGTPYTSDTSIVYSYGGGLDYPLFGNFAARGDFQYEKWYLDKYTPADYHPLHLSPYSVNFGVVYRFGYTHRVR